MYIEANSIQVQVTVNTHNAFAVGTFGKQVWYNLSTIHVHVYNSMHPLVNVPSI